MFLIKNDWIKHHLFLVGMTLSTGLEGKKSGLAWKHLALLVLLSHLDNA